MNLAPNKLSRILLIDSDSNAVAKFIHMCRNALVECEIETADSLVQAVNSLRSRAFNTVIFSSCNSGTDGLQILEMAKRFSEQTDFIYYPKEKPADASVYLEKGALACISQDEPEKLQNLICESPSQEVTTPTETETPNNCRALDIFAGALVHDLNNLLGIILTNASLAKAIFKGENPSLDDSKDAVEEVITATERARAMVNQLIVLRQSKRSAITNVDVGRVAQCSLHDFQNTLPDSIKMSIHIEADCPRVKGEEKQVRHLLENLCKNAKRSLNGKFGVIEIRIETIQIGEDIGSGSVHMKTGPYLRISVREQGRGDYRRQTLCRFDPFDPTSIGSENVNLCLLVAYAMASSLGGRIFCQSVPKIGNEFACYLPTEPAKKLPAASEDTPDSGRRALLIHPDIQFGGTVRRILTARDFETQCSTSITDALDALQSKEDSADLIICYTDGFGERETQSLNRITHLASPSRLVLISKDQDFVRNDNLNVADSVLTLSEPVSPEEVCRTAIKNLSHRAQLPQI